MRNSALAASTPVPGYPSHRSPSRVGLRRNLFASLSSSCARVQAVRLSLWILRVIPDWEVQTGHHLRIRGADPYWAVFLFSGSRECAPKALLMAMKGISTWMDCVRFLFPVPLLCFWMYNCPWVSHLVFSFDSTASESHG